MFFTIFITFMGLPKAHCMPFKGGKLSEYKPSHQDILTERMRDL